MCNAAARLGKRRWGRGRRGKAGQGQRAVCHTASETPVGFHVGSDRARDAWLCLVLVPLLCGSGALPAARVGHGLGWLGLKIVIITSGSHLGGGFCALQGSFSPAQLGAASTLAQHRCLRQLGGGRRAGSSPPPGSPSPLRFNTPLHPWLVCTAQNVLSIISICTFATVCASCTLKTIKSSFVCLQGNCVFFPSLDKTSSHPKTRHQPPLGSPGPAWAPGEDVPRGKGALCVQTHWACTMHRPMALPARLYTSWGG